MNGPIESGVQKTDNGLRRSSRRGVNCHQLGVLPDRGGLFRTQPAQSSTAMGPQIDGAFLKKCFRLSSRRCPGFGTGHKHAKSMVLRNERKAGNSVKTMLSVEWRIGDLNP